MLLEELPLLDAGTNAEATHYETGNWSKMSWCTASMRAAAAGFHPESFSTTTGSYWSATSFTGGAATYKYVSGSAIGQRYIAIWLCLDAAAHNGYRIKFIEEPEEVSTLKFKAIIYRVTGGVETVLVESAEVETLVGKHFGAWNNNGVIEAWTQPEAGGWSLLTSHADSTYTSGFIGIDGSGSNPALQEWKGASSSTGKLLGMVV